MYRWGGLSGWFESYHSKRQEHRHYNIILFINLVTRFCIIFRYVLARCRDVMLPVRKARGMSCTVSSSYFIPLIHT
jgi:hypothetical protein